MRDRRCLVLGTLILSLFLAGCGQRGKEVIAWVNGKKISAPEFEEKLGQIPVYFQENATQRRKFLDSLVERQILLAEAKKRRLANNSDVKNRLKAALDQILIEELIKKAIPEVTVKEEELKGYYEEKKPQFIERKKVRVSQILVRSEADAKEILKQLKKGTNFETLARTKSVSPDASRGGDIGYFGPGEMLPEFEKAAFALKKGEMSSIVKSPFGYHILKVIDKQEKRQKTFSEAKEEIRAIFSQNKQKEALDTWFKDLKKKAKIKINEEYFAKQTDQGEEIKTADQAETEGKKQ